MSQWTMGRIRSIVSCCSHRCSSRSSVVFKIQHMIVYCHLTFPWLILFFWGYLWHDLVGQEFELCPVPHCQFTPKLLIHRHNESVAKGPPLSPRVLYLHAWKYSAENRTESCNWYRVCSVSFSRYEALLSHHLWNVWGGTNTCNIELLSGSFCTLFVMFLREYVCKMRIFS
jgi:hypothetical protein